MTTGPREESPAEQAPYARRMSRGSSVSYLDCLFSVLAGSEQTDGRFGLMEMVAPKGREPRFSEPAEGTTLPTPSGAPDPELLKAMAADLASYGTEVIGPPGPPQEG